MAQERTLGCQVSERTPFHYGAEIAEGRTVPYFQLKKLKLRGLVT